MNIVKLMAVVAAVLPAAIGLACGVRLDISGETVWQIVIAESGRTLPDGYQGYPMTPAVTAFASKRRQWLKLALHAQ